MFLQIRNIGYNHFRWHIYRRIRVLLNPWNSYFFVSVFKRWFTIFNEPIHSGYTMSVYIWLMFDIVPKDLDHGKVFPVVCRETERIGIHHEWVEWFSPYNVLSTQWIDVITKCTPVVRLRLSGQDSLDNRTMYCGIMPTQIQLTIVLVADNHLRLVKYLLWL